jgi:hypothetical protein
LPRSEVGIIGRRASPSDPCLRHQPTHPRTRLVGDGRARRAPTPGRARRRPPALRPAPTAPRARDRTRPRGRSAQRHPTQLGHRNLGVTSIYLQGIDPGEIIETVHARRPPMIPASAASRSPSLADPLDTAAAFRSGAALLRFPQFRNFLGVVRRSRDASARGRWIPPLHEHLDDEVEVTEHALQLGRLSRQISVAPTSRSARRVAASRFESFWPMRSAPPVITSCGLPNPVLPSVRANRYPPPRRTVS